MGDLCPFQGMTLKMGFIMGARMAKPSVPLNSLGNFMQNPCIIQVSTLKNGGFMPILGYDLENGFYNGGSNGQTVSTIEFPGKCHAKSMYYSSFYIEKWGIYAHFRV